MENTHGRKSSAKSSSQEQRISIEAPDIDPEGTTTHNDLFKTIHNEL